MKLKKLLCLALSVVMVTGLAACKGNSDSTDSTKSNEDSKGTEASKDQTESGTTSEEEVTLSVCVYYGGDSTALADYAAEKVKEQLPNVTLEFEPLPQDGGQTIKTRAATGDLPDLLLVDSGTIEALTKSGSIIPLDDYVDEFNYRDKIIPAIADNCLVSPDGHIYQFPIGGISPILWYYNKELFEQYNVKVPTNYDELMTAVTTFRENDIIPMAMFGKEPWPLGAFFDTFALKENPAGFTAIADGEAKASDESYTKAIVKMEEIIKAGLFQDGSTNTDFDTASALFKEEKAAMFLNGSWYISDAISGLGDKVDFIVSYPTADAGNEGENQYSMAGGGDTCGMAVTTSAKDKDLAAKVAAIFAENREIAEYTKMSFITTPIKTDGLVLDNPLDAMSQRLLDAIPDLTYDSSFIHTLPNTKFGTSLTEELQKLLVGESAEDFIANVDKSYENSK